MDLLGSGHGLCQCLGLVLAIRTDGYDTPSCSDQLPIAKGGTGMEDHTALNFSMGDGEALFIGLRIATADAHHTDSGTGVEGNLTLVEVTLGNAFEEVHNVALKTEHDTLGFRVTHTAVVLDNLGLAVAIDKSEEDETFVHDALLTKTVHGRCNDFALHTCHPFGSGKGDRTHTAHSTGIQSGISLADALIVLRLWEDFVVLAVGQDKNTALYTAQELFNDYTRRGIAEHSSEHLAEFALCFLQAVDDEHALSGAQSVGLQHIRSLQGFEETTTFFHLRTVECLICSSGDAMTLHEGLRKILATFEDSSGFRGPDDWHVRNFRMLQEVVIDTFHQRVFRTYHNHIHLLCLDEGGNGVEIIGLDGHILAHKTCSGISGSNVELLNLWTLCDFPCKGVFAAARTEE